MGAMATYVWAGLPEADQRPDGERPSKHLRAVGDATLSPDAEAAWTRRIWDKHINGPTARTRAALRLRERQRVLIRIVPSHIITVAST
jgi:hypothetical protein